MKSELTASRSARTTLSQKVGAALESAVSDAIEEHRRLALPLVVWKDGKVVLLPPDQVQTQAVHESRGEYKTGDANPDRTGISDKDE